MLKILPIETPTLGDRSYLVHDGREAFVIDPQRDIDRVLELAADHGVQIRHVFETHIHNDYVTGGRALADATGAAYHVNAEDPVTFDRKPISDGDIVDVSPTLSVRALATPGHTFTHLSYALAVDGQQVGVFTGGSLLFGSVGRPDLLGPASTDALVHAQYDSAHRLATELPDDAEVFPTHGFGSFCTATQSEGSASTIGNEKQNNPALTSDEPTFVRELLSGLDAYPAYYAHMSPANLHAPDRAPDLTLPCLADAAEIHRRIDAGEWVVDLRGRTAYAAGHVNGALNFGLDGMFATYLGWVIPWETPLTLLGETAEQVADAQRELVRIGIDRPDAAAIGPVDDWAAELALHRMKVVKFTELEPTRARRDIVVLDVRRNQEWADGHVTGAIHLPLHELLDRVEEIPPGELWVHCGTGYRASIAASILEAAGRDVVLIDDDYTNAAVSGVDLHDSDEVAA